jgi:hypothetical protein
VVIEAILDRGLDDPEIRGKIEISWCEVRKMRPVQERHLTVDLAL